MPRPTSTMQRIQNDLLARRKELLGMVVGNLNGLSVVDETGDAADDANVAMHAETSRRLAEMERQELAKIDKALRRLKLGRYGVCAGCGGKIPVGRLQALPYSTRCVACQSKAEQRRKTDADAWPEDFDGEDPDPINNN